MESVSSGGSVIEGEEVGYMDNDVSMLCGSLRLRLVDASSRQMAHWSRGSAQYFPLLMRVESSASGGSSSPVRDRTGCGSREDIEK